MQPSSGEFAALIAFAMIINAFIVYMGVETDCKLAAHLTSWVISLGIGGVIICRLLGVF